MGFPRKRSIRTSSEIGRVIRQGARLREGGLTLHLLAVNSGEPGRWAFAVARHGHTIVERNRLRRRLQEIVRLNPLDHDEGALTVIRTAPRAYSRNYRELERDYLRLARRAGQMLARGPVSGGDAPAGAETA